MKLKRYHIIKSFSTVVIICYLFTVNPDHLAQGVAGYTVFAEVTMEALGGCLGGVLD